MTQAEVKFVEDAVARFMAPYQIALDQESEAWWARAYPSSPSLHSDDTEPQNPSS